MSRDVLAEGKGGAAARPLIARFIIFGEELRSQDSGGIELRSGSL